jgi:hypothetical protein
MALLTHDWRPNDPTGAINLYMRGVAMAREQEAQQQKQQAIVAEAAAKNILARQNQQRLAEADRIRVDFEQREADRRFELSTKREARMGAGRAGRAGSSAEPWTDLPVSGSDTVIEAAPAEPVDGASTVLGAGGPGARLNWMANSGENSNLPALSLQQPNPYAAPVTPVDPIASVAEPLTDPESPAPAIAGADVTLESGAQFGGTPLAAPADPAMSDLPTGGAAELGEGDLFGGAPAPAPGTGAAAVLSPAQTRALNELGRQDPKLARQAYKEILVKQVNKPATHDGAPITWLDETTAMTKTGRLLRKGEDGELTPLATKRVSSAYRGSDGVNYTQFSDGSWQDDKEPPVGVTIAKIGASQPQVPLEEQIKEDGYAYVGKPGYENVVTNKDGTALLIASQGANGKVTYKPYKSSEKIQSLKDGRVIRILPNGETQEVANASAVPAKDAVNFTEALKAEAAAQDEVDALETAKTSSGTFALTNPTGVRQGKIDAAAEKLQAAKREVSVYRQRYPSLATKTPAEGPDDPVPVVSPQGKTGTIPRSQLEGALQAGYRQR